MEKVIAYEVDLQNDFMDRDGRLYVPGAEEIRSAVATAVNFVLAKNIRRIRGMDRHFADDEELVRNGGPFGDHCMDWKYGQRSSSKYGVPVAYGIDFIPELKVGSAINVERKVGEGKFRTYSDSELLDIARKGRDLVFEKQNYDVFTNPAVEPLLKIIGAEKAIVYGVATDYCVKAAVLGMQRLGIQTFVLEDALSGISEKGSADARKEMESAGAKFIRTADLSRYV